LESSKLSVVKKEDLFYMKKALRLAQKGLGFTTPNPSVGCVIVQSNGEIVGLGITEPNRARHAEVVALQMAGERAHNLRGATLYTTLEPCSHTVGSDGLTRVPCATHIADYGIVRVVSALQDPDTRVCGRGYAMLESANIALTKGVCEAEAAELYRGFIKQRTTGLPYILQKAAMTADGKLASPTGHSRWVTSERARAYVHQLRQESDIVIVGVGTVIADNPSLTTRLPKSRAGNVRHPLRVVIDSKLRTPLDANVVGENTIFFATTDAPQTAQKELLARGARVEVVAPDKTGRVDILAAMQLLGNERNMFALLESGGTLAAAFWRLGLIDEVLYIIAPKIMGGASAPTPVDGAGLSGTMEEAVSLEPFRVKRLGEDIALSAKKKVKK
jgi:diaminohydroxyphosphoribosylaminopyrimidine deaminase / 5-amino-6-(5-phosphoribosylamino)uracil reductase